MISDRLVLVLLRLLEINSYIPEGRDKEIVKLQLTFSIQDGLGRDRRKDSE